MTPAGSATEQSLACSYEGGRRLKLAIVDTQPAGRARLAAILATDQTFAIMAAVPSLEHLPSAAERHRLDTVLVVSGADPPNLMYLMTRRAATFGRPVILANWPDSGYVLAALAAGAHGCLVRYPPPGSVLAAIRTAAAGGALLSLAAAGQVHAKAAPNVADSCVLAPREAQTLALIASGFTQAQVARRMGVSQSTVGTYKQRIRRKLNAGDMADLTRQAEQLGQLVPWCSASQ